MRSVPRLRVEPVAPEPMGLAGIATLWPALAGAALFRFACYAAMTALALWNELRPAATVPDLAIEHLPFVPAVARWNYLLWLALYVPLVAALLYSEPRRWIRYMVTGGLVSLVRGATIALTGLGPPDPAVAGPGAAGHAFWPAFLDLVSPFGVFARNSYGAYLTKDLFFSGHAATTFLLLLYLWHRPRLRWAALAAHLAVVLSVLFSHIHYAIDLVGAWAFTFAIYALREGWPRRRAVRQ